MGFRNLLAVTAVALVCAETNAQTGRPRIVGQPQKQIVPAGQVAQFEVIAESDTPVQYEWYHGGSTTSDIAVVQVE